MPRATPPAAQTVSKWLRDNLGPRCLAPLTGTDTAALKASVQIIELYRLSPHPDLIHAFGNVVARMQEKCQFFAFHAIAHVMDWDDRSKIWSATDLPAPKGYRCRFEPGADDELR